MWLCIKAKLRGKNFLLNWLYIHEKKNHNVSLSMCCSLSVSLSVSWCQLSTRYQCLLLHIAIKALSAGSNPAFHTVSLLVFFFVQQQFSVILHILTTHRKPMTIRGLCIQVGRLAFLKALINPKPDLTCFPLDLWQLIPYLWTSAVSVLGNTDIFSSLQLLAQQWMIVQFHGKAQTAFFV